MFASTAKGSSDCSKVLGLNRFVTALLTLLEKKSFCTFYSYINDIFLQEDDKIINLANNY